MFYHSESLHAVSCLSCSLRYKNDQLISWKDEYRMKPARGYLTIYGVTEKDTGNYTVIMTNRVTREEQRRTFQLLVNGRITISLLVWLLSSVCLFTFTSNGSDTVIVCPFIQTILGYWRRKYLWIEMFICMEVALHLGVLLAEDPALSQYNGSGCPERTVQSDFSKSYAICISGANAHSGLE